MKKIQNAAKIAGSGALAAITAGAAQYDNLHYGGAPVVSGLWSATAGMLGKGMELRQDKALEWSTMLNENLPHIKEEVLESEEFQDTFITSFESYIRERDAEKRALLRNIFVDYTSVNNPNEYPIERYYEITRQLTMYEARLLSTYISQEGGILRFEFTTPTDYAGLQRVNTRVQKSHAEDIESTLHLVSLGLLIQDTTPVTINDDVVVGGNGERLPRVYVSKLGKKYAQFMTESTVS